MLKKLIPVFTWLPSYNRSDLPGDISAGIIVAIMLVPQGMAYAMLAGLPPVTGLYAATIPLFIYALFGTSRQLAVGPVAMVSLLVFSGVSTLAEPGTTDYISLTLLLALMIGIIQFLMGVLRLGFLVNFLSHAVISGFTSAAAIIIGFSQLSHLLGVKLHSDNTFLILIEAVKKSSEVNPIAFTIGLSSIILLIVIKNYIPKVPGPLVVVVLSILTVSMFKLNTFGVTIIGHVPGGLPTFSMPTLSIGSIKSLLPIALTISFIGFMESIAMAKAIANKEKYKVEPNKELIGLGLANVAGSFFSAFPVTGGFSRSAVNYQAGAKTPLASMITAVLITTILLFFTKLFYFLPNAVLAAIIIVAVYSLIDIKEAIYLFSIKRLDGWTWVITFIGTLIIGVEQGILVGFAFSIIVFIARSAYPHIAELGLLKAKNVYRNIERYPEAQCKSNTLILRIDSSLYFANMNFIEESICKRVGEAQHIRTVILDFSSVNSIDAIAISSLENMMENCQQKNIELLFSGIKGPVMDLLDKADWNTKFGNKIGHISVEQALKSIEV